MNTNPRHIKMCLGYRIAFIGTLIMFLATHTQGQATHTQGLATHTQGLPITSETCVPCSEPIPSTKATKTSDAPHVLINYKSLQATVDANLKPCHKCKQSTLRLVQKKRTNFAVTLEIVCDNCVTVENKIQNEIQYLNTKLSNLYIHDNEQAKIKKSIQRQLVTKKKELTIYSNNEHRTIRHSKNSKFLNNKKKGREPALSYNLNIRAMLMAFYCGTGGFNIGSFASFIGISGGGSWNVHFIGKVVSFMKLY